MDLGESQSLRGLHLPRAALLSPSWNLLHLHSLIGHPGDCPQGAVTPSMVSKDTKCSQPGAAISSPTSWDSATTLGSHRNPEMWLASAGAHLHPLVASTHYQPGEALEKAKPHLLVRKRLWPHLFLCLPEEQGLHHALQLSLEGTPLPRWPLSPPGPAQVPGGQGQPQQPPQHSTAHQGQQEPLHRLARGWERHKHIWGSEGVHHKGWGFWGHGRALGCPSPLCHGSFSFCTSTGPTVSRWSVPSPGNAVGGYVQCSPAQVQEPSQDPKTTWGHPVPALVPGMSPWRVSAAGQPVSQQWHGVLWTGSSTLCQLGEEKTKLGGGFGGPQTPPQDPHGANPEEMSPSTSTTPLQHRGLGPVAVPLSAIE